MTKRRSTLLRPMLAVVLLLVAGAIGLGAWVLGSTAGAAWLLGLLPGLHVEQLRGTLLGDLDARRVTIALPGGSPGSVIVDDLAWRGLRIAPAAPPHWLRIEVDELRVARVVVTPAHSDTPAQAPASLALPIGLGVRALHIHRLQAPGLGDEPLRDLRAGLQLGADGGRVHVVDGLALAWQHIDAQGALRIGTAPPFDVQATVQLAQPDWQVEASLRGPLESLQVGTRLRGRAPKDGTAPAVDAEATLRPFAAWPLGALEARTHALDLAAIHPSLPATAIDGSARVRSEAMDRPAEINLTLDNRGAGRVNDGRLPLRRLAIGLRARPDDPKTLEVHGFDAELGTAEATAGRVTGRGNWTPANWTVEMALAAVEPARLDARAPALRLSGPLTLAGSGFDSADRAAARIDARADLAGRFAAQGRTRDARLKLDAGADLGGLALRRAELEAGGARARLEGTLRRPDGDGRWRASGKLDLARFDPQPWWPGRSDSPWRKGPHRLNAQAGFDLSLPDAARRQPWSRVWPALRGQATLSMADSLLAGVPVAGQARLRNDGRGPPAVDLTLDADGNRLRAQGSADVPGDGRADRWELTLAAPALARLAPVLRLVAADLGSATGSVDASARIEGRWPALHTEGRLDASGLRVGGIGVRRAQGRWQLAPSADAPLVAELQVTQAALDGRGVETAQLDVAGTLRDHGITLRVGSKALPPAWVDEVQALASGTEAVAATRSTATLEARGGFVDEGGVARAGWRGRLAQLELRGDTGRRWFAATGIDGFVGWAGGPLRAELQPGRAELLGTTVRWSRVAWQDGEPARLDAQAELDPLAIAPLLARVQPDFGWGGDLRIGARLEVRSSPAFAADIVVERRQGDLSVTDETGTTALGLTDLRLGLNVADGVWSFTQALAGRTLGVAAGAVVARTAPQARWPPADTPISGVVELQLANLGTWGPWVPPGWRLGGALRLSAAIGGRFGAPEYTGEVRGSGLSVRNFVEGVAVSDGEVAIHLDGPRAQIERITARAGEGSVRLEGVASLGEAPQADLRLVADRFQLLGRVDRRIVASGDARLQLDSDALALDGRLRVDEGLIDFTRGDAPGLSSDVLVLRPQSGNGRAAAPASAAASAVTPASATPGRRVGPPMPPARLDVRVDLGDRLRLRGRGLDTGLAGELRITSPGGRPALNGTVSAVDGSYAAYGQKLAIERGAISFVGPAENPRLDIEATRPNLDVRVGVAVTGTAMAPRIRLFSEPELPEIDKLSWLLLGRPSDGLGSTETALMQRAALALLAGEGNGVTDQLIAAIGLDEVSVRQTDGEVRETVVSLGKQLSRRWYVGYERGLNDTMGTWQLTYRVARRFTLRAQSGLDNALDAIWIWRWQ